MTKQIYNLLNKIYPTYRQGSMSATQQYPDNFFTYWNNYSELDSYYDDGDNLIIWSYDINFYTCEIKNIDEVLNGVVNQLRADNDIVIEQYIHDVASDEPSHVGKGLTISILERRNK